MALACLAGLGLLAWLVLAWLALPCLAGLALLGWLGLAWLAWLALAWALLALNLGLAASCQPARLVGRSCNFREVLQLRPPLYSGGRN